MSNPSQNSSITIHRYADVNMKNLDISDLQVEGTQPIAYVKYNHNVRKSKIPLYVRSGVIKISSHGIPKIQEPHCPDDTKREFIKVPLDLSQKTCAELHEFLVRVDEYMASDEVSKKLFGAKKSSEYTYHKCIREPQELDDFGKGESKKFDGPKINFAKMHFHFSNPNAGKKDKKEKFDKSNRKLATKFTKIEKIDGKNSKKRVEFDSITKVAECLNRNAEIKFVFYFSKIWVMQAKKEYGVGFKIMACNFIPGISNAINPDDIEISDEDDDEDDDEVNEKYIKSSSKPSAKTLDCAKQESSASKTKTKSKFNDEKSESESNNESDASENKSDASNNKSDDNHSDTESDNNSNDESSKNNDDTNDSNISDDVNSLDDSDDSEDKSSNKDVKKDVKNNKKSVKDEKKDIKKDVKKDTKKDIKKDTKKDTKKVVKAKKF